MTAGFRCAPGLGRDDRHRQKTAMPHPQVTIRNPPLLPLVPLSATLATTPQPSRVSMAVPNTSDRKTIPRDIFDSSIFCCQSLASLKGRWAGSGVGAAGRPLRRSPLGDPAVLVPGPMPARRRKSYQATRL